MADPDLIARTLARPTMGLCRSDELVARGVAWSTVSRRIARGVWERPHRGVVDVTGQSWRWERRVVAAILSCPPGTLASHGTAAALLDLPGLPRAGTVHVTAPRRARTRDVPFTVHSTVLPDPGMLRDEVPCTTPPRTAVDLATCLHDRAYARAVRELLRRGDLLPGHVEDETLRRLPGVGRLRRTIRREWDNALHDTESLLEDDVLAWLTQRGVGSFVTQHEVDVPDPSLPPLASGRLRERRFRLDIAWPARRVAIEVLGARWHADELATAARRHRRQLLEDAGWTIIDVRADDLHGTAAGTLATRLAAVVSG